MRYLIIFLTLFQFAFSTNLPNVKIAFFDQNNTFITPQKRDFYNAARLTIPKNQKATIKIILDKFFTQKGNYYLVVNGAKAKGCYEFYQYSVCPFVYNKKRELIAYNIEPQKTNQYIIGAVVYKEYQYFNLQNRVNKLYMVGFVILGIIVIAALYSFILFLALRNMLYFYYFLVQIGFFIYTFLRLKITNIYLYTEFVWAMNALLLALIVNFSIAFLKSFDKNRYCTKILYFALIYAIVSALLFLFGFMFHFYGSFALLVILYCLLKNFKHLEVKLYTLSMLIITLGVIYIEFFPQIWQKHIHPLVFIIPSEAILMLIVIGLRLHNLDRQRKERLELLIHYNKNKKISSTITSIAHKLKNQLSSLSFAVMNIQLNNQNNESLKTIEESISKLNETVKNALNVYQNSNENKNLKSLFKELIKQFTFENIEFIIDIDDKVFTTKSQVVKEIATIAIENSIDEFKNKDIKNPIITIRCQNNICTICDNAQEKVDLSTLHQPKISSKRGGSGIGLYIANLLSKEHFHREIKGKNTKEGFCLIFHFD